VLTQSYIYDARLKRKEGTFFHSVPETNFFTNVQIFESNITHSNSSTTTKTHDIRHFRSLSGMLVSHDHYIRLLNDPKYGGG
jgi:hypothetical protein